MKIKIRTLRKLIQEALRKRLGEEAWVPGRYYPGNEPLSPEDVEKLSENDEDLGGGDAMPADSSGGLANPTRPEDPYEYLGMRPSPTAAMAHPASGGGGGGDMGSAVTSTSDVSTEETEV